MDLSISTEIVICFGLYLVLLMSALKLPPSSKQSLTMQLCVYTARYQILLICLLLFCAWQYQLINPSAIAFSVFFLFTSYLYRSSHTPFKILLGLVIAIGSVALSIHLIPGFNNKIISHSIIGNATLSFTLTANLDKALAAFFILTAFQRRIKYSTWQTFIHEEAVYLIMGLVVIFLLAMLLGAKIDIKFGQLSWAFAFFNLFVTCIAEESFFRLVVQDTLRRKLNIRYNKQIAAGCTAVIFTLAHYHTGEGALERLTLIFCAGYLYALIYMKNRSFSTAVIAHFSVNMIHFSFFTYPF
jgi:membrane protease YdiL (CAAX protease family)